MRPVTRSCWASLVRVTGIVASQVSWGGAIATWRLSDGRVTLSPVTARTYLATLLLAVPALQCGASAVDGSADSKAELEANVAGAPPLLPTEAADSPSAERGEPTLSNCRWHGYGIGPSGSNQCDQQHLMVHSALPSLALGATGVRLRDVAGVCAVSVQEVQALCCYEGKVPETVDLTAAPSVADFLNVHSDTPVNSATLRALAANECSAHGGQLSDWHMLYEGDTEQGRALAYLCESAPPASSFELSIAGFEQPSAGALLDADPSFVAAVEPLIPPRGSSRKAAHLSGESSDDAVLEARYRGLLPKASGYSAVSFWARSEQGDSPLRVQHASAASSELPWPVATVTVTRAWQKFEVSFRDLLASAPKTRPIEAAGVDGETSIRFSSAGEGPFDLWLDDVAYICGSGECRGASR